MKLREIIHQILTRIDRDSGFSHLLINNEINEHQLTDQDAALLTEIVYGTVQNQLSLDYYLEKFINKNQHIDHWVRILLRMSVYQMVYLDRVPDHAIIYEAVEIAKKRGHKGTTSFVNGVLRNIQRQGVPSPSKINDPVERLAVETSHPKWLVERWIDQYGFDTTKAMCQANVMQKPMSIRIQPLRITRQEAIEQLEKLGLQVKPSSLSKQGIIVEKGNVLATPLFKNGYVTIQDQSSMLATEMLDVAQGMFVLDACSAPGGKTTHIAEKMGNKGEVHAYDLHEKKVKIVQQKAKELNLSIIHANKGDARKLQNKYKAEHFDRILIDAPCSGLGVIRSKPDIKYHKQVKDIENLSEIQFEILSSVSPLLKKGGKLVYSTCTVDQKENVQVVKRFLEHHRNFIFDPQFHNDLPSELNDTEGVTSYGIQLFPQTMETDGFFIARLVKQA